MRKIMEVSFVGVEEIKRLAYEKARLMHQNAETAVAKTTLLGITSIVNDCPVDTGRLRASIAGELADISGVALEGSDSEISEGKGQSLSSLEGLEGRIGTNVEYAVYVEYGTAGRAVKQAASRSGATIYSGGMRGKGYFRNNIPPIKDYFHREMKEAIKATKNGRLLREGN